MKEIIKQFKEKKPKPIYLLHGEESYYIDELTDAAQKYLLEEHERDFNLTVFYGKDTDAFQIQEQVKQFPVMAALQLVIVKEAQEVKNWEKLESYLENPSPHTVLILAHKHKKTDSRKKFYKLINKNGFVFESKKLYENQVEAWISKYLKEKGYTINAKASLLLVAFLGSDLAKIVKELEKLMIILPKGTLINETDIEKNIGISKNYNVFELSNAIGSRDIIKANKIITYFEQNPKATHITAIIPLLFSFHERLMKVHALKTNDVSAIMSQLKMSYPAAKEAVEAKRNYPLKKVAKNIQTLLKYDLKSKGIQRGPGTDADLLRELIFQLIH